MENEERNVFIAENYIRNRIINCAIYLIIASVFFTFGYCVGNSSVNEPVSAITDIPAPTASVVEEIWYEVKISDNRLYLYSVSNSETKELVSEEISSEIFPYDDMRELEKGLAFESFANALACFEDFVS